MKRYFMIIMKYGFDLPKESSILDFGCGIGRTVYDLHDLGYLNTVGYDVYDRVKLRIPSDRSLFFVADSQSTKLPFSDNEFDFVISEQVFEHVMDQVGLLRELYRVMRPGACALHIMPGRYRFIEGHFYVPFGGVFAHRWWYKIWAMLGIRNEYQRGCSSEEVADLNSFYFVSSLNYVPNSCYQVVWRRLGYKYYWAETANWLSSHRRLVRAFGQLSHYIPILGWLYRTFHTRIVLLVKSSNCPSSGNADL